MIDVAIVGGGPAGLLSGLLLAEAGVEATIFEEHPSIGTPTHCTGIVSQEVATLTKIPEHLILKRLSSAQMVSPGGRRSVHEWSPATGENLWVIDRAGFDRALAEAAVLAGAEVRTGARVTDIQPRRDRLELCVAGATISARACVLACGVAYRFQRRLGLGLPGHVLHTAQLEVEAAPSDEVEMYFGREVAPEGFVWTVPVVREGTPHLKIGVLSKGDAGSHLAAFLRRPQVRARLRAETPSPLRRLLPVRPIPKTYAERVVVVGDAGGFTKPTTGGGIFYSLLTATLAVQTLLEGFRVGRFDDEVLSVYERRWNDRLGEELRIAEWLRGMAAKCTDRDIDALIHAMASDDVRALIRTTAKFNWHRDLIVAMLRQRGIKALLVRALFR